MNKRTGKLSKREMGTLNRAWEILSRWTEIQEEDAARHGYEPDTDFGYVRAMDAVANLCDFIGNYE